MSESKKHLCWRNWCDENPDIASNPQEFMNAVFARLAWLEDNLGKDQATIKNMEIIDNLIEFASGNLRDGQSVSINITRGRVSVKSDPFVKTIEIPESEIFGSLYFSLQEVIVASIAYAEREAK
jgi:hypothetical protein